MTYSEMDLDILPTLAEGPRRSCCRRGRPPPPLTVSSSSKALSPPPPPPPPPTKADRTFRRQPPPPKPSSSSPIFLFFLSRWWKTWERSESPTFFYLFLRERKIAPFPTFSFHLQGKNLLPPVVTSLHRRRRAANGLARGVRSKKALRYLLSSFFSLFDAAAGLMEEA